MRKRLLSKLLPALLLGLLAVGCSDATGPRLPEGEDNEDTPGDSKDSALLVVPDGVFLA